MTIQAQNAACCELLGWTAATRDEDGDSYICVYGASHWHKGESFIRPLFTEDDGAARLLRAALIEADLTEEFVDELDTLITKASTTADGFPHWQVFDLLQATPAQQVEAALKALGKWQEESE